MRSNQARLFSRISVIFLLIGGIWVGRALSAGTEQDISTSHGSNITLHASGAVLPDKVPDPEAAVITPSITFDTLNASVPAPILYAEPSITKGTQNTIYWNGPPPDGIISSAEGEGTNTQQDPLQTVSQTLRNNDKPPADDGSEPAQVILNPENALLPKGDEHQSLSASDKLLSPMTIFSETFEGAFPGTSWTLSGAPTWGSTSYDKHGGSASAWCGGSSLDPASGYANNMSASMVYGPFSLSGATSAIVDFWYKNLSEVNWDYFGWYASADGINFYGSKVTGDQNSWRNQIFDLASVPTLGDLRGKPQVWIAFIFTSDGVGSGDRGYKGAYLDDIIITKNNSVLPNLIPYQPSGWSDKIVVSTGPGTNTDSLSLRSSDTLYVDWAVTNNGTADATTRFYTELYVDDVLKTSWYTDPPLSVGSYDYVLDYSIGSLAAGIHTIRIKTDSTGVIAEGVEGDNEYTKTITVAEAVVFYYAECADNSSFSNASNSPWTRMNLWTFTDLSVGQTYWYRVKARVGTIESDWSNVEFSQQAQAYPGSLQFSAAAYDVNENNGLASVTITRTGGTDGIVGAYCATSDGTAVAWADYLPTELDLSWADGDSADKTFAVQIINDTAWKGNRTVNLTLAYPSNGATLGSQSTAVLNIIEDESPPVSGALQFSAATYGVNENGGTATITATRTLGSSGAVSVHYATSDGTALAGSDYTAKSGDLSWADGDLSSKTFTVSITNDSVYEGNETINLTLSSPTGGALLGPQKTAVLTIVEDDPPVPGALQFSVAAYNVNENGGTATVTVTRTSGSDLAVGVHYATSDGTATSGTDYTAASGTLSWADKDSSSKTFTVSVANDTIWKGNRTVNLTLSSPTGGASLGAKSTAVLTIVEDEIPVPGTLQFSAAAYSVNENGGTAMITVTRAAGSDCAVAVHYATSNGTATAGSDYTATSGDLSWADKDSSSRTFTVNIIDDAIHESSKSINLTLSSPTGGAALGSQKTAVLTIIDDDPLAPGTLQFSAATYSVNENGGAATITVTRTGGSDGAVGIHYATSNGTAIAGTDYTAKSGNLSWSDKDSSNKTFTINIANDTIYEGNKTVNLTLSSPTGGAALGSQSAAVLTIIEDDSAVHGVLQFSSAMYSVNENGGTAIITVTRTDSGNGAVGVHYATTNGTATTGNDYTSASGDLSWADGDLSSKTFTVSILNDTIYEGNETINLTLTSPTGGATLGSQSTAVLTIVEDDSSSPGTLQFSAATYSANETSGTVTITVTRTGGSNGAVGIHWATSNGTATAGSDYTAASGDLSWSNGDLSSRTFMVSIINDTSYEGNETINLTLTSPTGGATLGSQSTAVLTIIDDDPPVPGTIQFGSATYSVNENGGSVTITVTRAGGSDGIVGVHYATSNGTATAGSDYTATSGDLSWPDKDSSSKTFTVNITNDSVWEGNETINLALTSPTGGATLGSQSTAVLTIVEDDTPISGTLQFSAAAYSVNENSGTATITVTRIGGSDGMVGVHYATSNGTAAAGSDYMAVSGDLSWLNGDSSDKTFTVAINNDSVWEGNETVNLVLTSPTGGAILGSQTAAVLTIIEDDIPVPGILQFSAATYSVNENGGTATITVTRTGGSNGAVGIHYTTSNGTATDGSDYTAASGDLNWPNADSSAKTFTVSIINDASYEGNETVNLTLTSPTGGATLGSQSTAVLTIVEDDAPVPGTLQFSSPTYSVNENGGTVTITVTRTGGSDGTVGVHYATSNGTATAGSDYTATSGDLSWSNGDLAAKTFTVTIVDDAIHENSETVNLTLTSPTGGAALGSQSAAVLTITDDDPLIPGTLQFSAATYSVNENGGSVTITVTRTGGSDGAVSVHYATSNGTATAGIDYTTKSGDLNWSDKDSANKTFTINIVNDSIYEGNEIVNLTLTSPTGDATLGSQSTALLTIIEDDSPVQGTLQFSAATYSMNENGGTVTITVTRTGGSDGAVSVHYATSNSTATAGSDYTEASGELSWPDKDSSSKTFPVTITNDTIYEGNETVNLTLTSPTGGAVLGSQSTAVLTIVEDDAPVPGALQFSAATYSVNENGGSVTITVTRTGGSDGAVGVHYATSNGTATAGSDYTLAYGDLSWPDKDSSSKTFAINVTNDSIYEGNETVNLTLTSPTGGVALGTQSTAVLTIVEDDSPVQGTLQFSAATYSVNENGGSVTITVMRTGGSGGAVGVHYATSNGTATAGSDYTATSGDLSWPDKDSSSKTFTVSITNDIIYKGNRTINLTLASPTGGAVLGNQSTAVLTIIEDDSPVPGALQFNAATYSVNENGGTTTITVTRTGGSDGAVGVHYATSDGTAVAGSDYMATSGNLSWPDKDSSSKMFTVSITNDTIYKGNRTINLSLTSPTGGATLGSQSTAVLTIVEDDIVPSSLPWLALLLLSSSGETTASTQSQWGSGSKLYCSTSPAEFSLTNSGMTKNSTVDLSTDSTWEGWEATASGIKSFSWKLSSSDCGTFAGSFKYLLSEGASYLFQMALDGLNPVINVYTGEIDAVIWADNRDVQASSKTAEDIKASMRLVDKIPLNIPQGEFLQK